MKDTTLALSLAGLAFMMTVIWGGPSLRILRYFKIGKLIRVDEPGHHNVKMGTPTMGGVMFILPVVLLTVLLNAVALFGLNVVGRSVLVPLDRYGRLRHSRRNRRLAGNPWQAPRRGHDRPREIHRTGSAWLRNSLGAEVHAGSS